MMIYEGNGVEKENEKAINLFKKAIDLNYTSSEYAIAYPLVELGRIKEAREYVSNGYKKAEPLCKDVMRELNFLLQLSQ